MASRTKRFLLILLACIFMWADLVENLVQSTVCNGFFSEIASIDSPVANSPETTRIFHLILVQKLLSALPLVLFSSFLCVSLTHRVYSTYSDCENLKDLLIVTDQHEMIYSHHDLAYVRDLLSQKTMSKKEQKATSVTECSTDR